MEIQDLKLTKKEIAMLYFPEGLYEKKTENQKDVLKERFDSNTQVGLTFENFKKKIIQICTEFVNQLEKDTDFKTPIPSDKPYEIGVYFSRKGSNENQFFIGLDPQVVIEKKMPENFIFQIDVYIGENALKNSFLRSTDIYELEVTAENPTNYWYCKSLDRKLLIGLDNVKNKEKFFKKAKKSLDKLLIRQAIIYNSSKS